jgi:hypothetical protein
MRRGLVVTYDGGFALFRVGFLERVLSVQLMLYIEMV